MVEGVEGERAGRVDGKRKRKKDSVLPVVALYLVLFHGIVLIQIKGYHIGKGEILFLVHAYELLINGSGSRASSKSQHALVGFRANAVSNGPCYSLACVLWSLVNMQWDLLTYTQLWGNLQYIRLCRLGAEHFASKQ